MDAVLVREPPCRMVRARYNNTKRPKNRNWPKGVSKNPKRAERRFEFGVFGRFFVCFATGPSCTYAPGLTPHRKGFALAVSPPLLILLSPWILDLLTCET